MLKIRYYGARESCDFRTAASVSQFYENSAYLEVSAALKQKTCLDVLGKYAAKYTLIRRSQSKKVFNNRILKKKQVEQKEKSKKATKKNEKCEGITYETGIGVFGAELLKVQKIVEKRKDTKQVNLWLPKKNTSAKSKNSTKSNHVLPLEIELVLLFMI